MYTYILIYLTNIIVILILLLLLVETSLCKPENSG